MQIIYKGDVFIYTENEIKEILYKYNLSLIKFNNVKNIIAIDNDGFKYKITLSNLLNGRTPHKYMKNPYAFNNFLKYMTMNYPYYMLIDSEYLGCKHKMRFICIYHLNKGIQFNTPDNIINNKHICKYCSYEKMKNERILCEDKIINLCEQKNVIYINRYTKNNESIIKYKCDKHENNGIQEMSLTHFKESNVPCHYCNISNGEKRIIDFLNKYKIEYKYQYSFKDCVFKRPLKFDFYIHNQNILIEYDGKQHFMPVKFWDNQDSYKNFLLCKQRDNIKNEYCDKHNIKLIRIPYTQYNNIENILTSELSDVIFMHKIIESSETAVSI